ncbi:MAG TPA: methyltransferase domain-containing protein [Solirubrobacterales bacterium]|nr:methyltransferase domain-containing protein [Solirubrobacterales bacterium]
MAELSEAKQAAREMWAGGKYAEIVDRIADAGRTTVAAAEVGEGDTVLDVACGTGNATIPAAQTGAEVTGLDLTPELLEQGKVAAADAGVEIEWVEGDAEQLPFEDDSFDVVLSVFGCMFAPDQRRAAEELARVLKPGGRLAVAAWTPEGNIGKFFRAVADHMPPPPEGFQPPILWGDEDHVRGLFEGTGVDLSFDRAQIVFEHDSPEAFLEEYELKLPPLVAARAVLEPEGNYEPLRADLLEAYMEGNEADDGYRSPGEYLVIKGRKAA